MSTINCFNRVMEKLGKKTEVLKYLEQRSQKRVVRELLVSLGKSVDTSEEILDMLVDSSYLPALIAVAKNEKTSEATIQRMVKATLIERKPNDKLEVALFSNPKIGREIVEQWLVRPGEPANCYRARDEGLLLNPLTRNNDLKGYVDFESLYPVIARRPERLPRTWLFRLIEAIPADVYEYVHMRSYSVNHPALVSALLRREELPKRLLEAMITKSPRILRMHPMEIICHPVVSLDLLCKFVRIAREELDYGKDFMKDIRDSEKYSPEVLENLELMSGLDF